MSWFQRAALTTELALCCAALACSTASETGWGSDGGSAETQRDPITMTLSPGALRLFPGQRAQLTARVDPPQVQRVELLLLGDSKQAFLSDLELYTSPQGEGHFWLTASGTEARFAIHARAEGSSARAEVMVTDFGFADVRIEPSYSGARSINQWVASARAGVDCASVLEITSDGPITAQSAPGEFPVLHNVLVGAPLAVTLRSGRAVAGCFDVVGLLAGELRNVAIVVNDIVPKFSSAPLELTFSATPEPNVLQHMDQQITSVLDAWAGPTTDIDLVLDEMRTQLQNELSRLSFDNRRAHAAWHDRLAESLAPDLADQGLRDSMRDSMRAGVQQWLSTETFEGDLIFASDTASRALFELNRVAAQPADAMGFARTHIVQAQRQPLDQLELSLAVYFIPSRLITGLARVNSSGRTAQEMIETLTEQVDCQTLAQTLSDVANGSASLSDCALAGTAKLCEQAMASLWRRLEESSSLPMRLPLSAVVTVSVDENAVPIALSGAWGGTLAEGAEGTVVSGSLHGGPN